MYCWSLLTGDISEVPFLMGITDDLAKAMRLCESYIESGRAFLGYIEAVRPAMTVHGMDPCYVPTGRHWVARRTNQDKVRWDERDGCFGAESLSPW